MCCMTQESSIEQLRIPLSEEQIAIVSGCDWSGAKHWVEWWTRESHLQMLSKPFTKMAPGVWNKAPRSTNGVERANSLAKDGDSRKNLCFVQCSLCMKKIRFLLHSIFKTFGAF